MTEHSPLDAMRYTAFTTDPAGGNPAGVVLLSGSADTASSAPGRARMQAVAADIGYSETAFATHLGGDDYEVRYFSPLAEVAFCGHATIATALALADTGASGTLRFHTPAGVIPVDVEGSGREARATLTSVATSSRAVDPRILAEALAALGWSASDLDAYFPPHVAFAGNDHLVLAARTRARLADLAYDFDALKSLMEREGWTTLQLFWPESETVVHARNPFPIGGVVEDPATGAAAAALGGYLKAIGGVPHSRVITIHQGDDMGRPSVLTLAIDPELPGVAVSGTAVRLPED